MDVLAPLREVASLRERKKAATRLALHHAVVELALAKGLDAVTVDEIADHANVSRRTFSNYFAHKEEAFLYKEMARYQRLVDQVRDRPQGESAWQALVNSAPILTEGMVGVDPARLSQLRLIRRHPSLAAHLMANQSTVERELADAIAARCQRSARTVTRHPDRAPTDPDAGPEVIAAGDAESRDIALALRSRVLAAIFLATVRSSMAVWTEHPDVPPDHLLTQALQAASERLR